jgi:hypothetical protein
MHEVGVANRVEVTNLLPIGADHLGPRCLQLGEGLGPLPGIDP